jgi:putative ABC transport system substrate-binding protein
MLVSFILASTVLLAGCTGLPFMPAPPKPLPKVGVLCGNCPPTYEGPVPPSPTAEAFVEGLRALGHADGETLTLIWRGAGGQNERLAALAEDLVNQQVDVLVSIGASPAAAAARKATSTIPIVFAGVGDPVGSGFIASFAHPGGNMTGRSNYSPETVGKRLEQLKDIAPSIKRVGALYSFVNPSTSRELQEAQEAAGRLGLTFDPWDVRSLADVEAAFQARMSPPPDALFFSGEPFLFLNRKRLLELVAERRLPASYNVREWAADGGLISYGFNLAEQIRGAASYVDRILKGNSPADLPVELPTTFDVVVNLKTARALGLTVPPSVLQQATEVIQ